MIDKSKLPVITSSNLYKDSNYEIIDENGLLSQRIFGPVKNFKCACGKYSSEVLHKNKICNVCGVICGSNNMRYTQFGKIVLPFPVYKPTLDVKQELRKIIGDQKHLLDPLQADLTSTTENFISYKDGKIKIVTTYDKHNCIPLIIRGGYTFYLSLLAAYHIFNAVELQPVIEEYYSREVIVLPPKCRAVTIIPKNNDCQMIKEEIVEYYIQLLKMCQYDWPTTEDPEVTNKNWITIIQNYKNRNVPIDDEELNNVDLYIGKYQRFVNKIYKAAAAIVSGKTGLIRKSFLAKSIDFSSRGHIVINPALAAHEIKIPKQIFMRLFFLEYLRFLYTYKKISLENLNVYVKQTEIKINNSNKDHSKEFIEWFFIKTNTSELDRLVLINRQPTLWRHGLPAVEVIGISNSSAIEISQLNLESLNADFDGDSLAIYKVHDTQAKLELQQNAYVKNCLLYDHNTNYLQTIRLESLYSAYVLLSSKADVNNDKILIDNLNELPLDFANIINITQQVILNSRIYSYGLCLFNNWCGFKNIKMETFTNGNDISKEIHLDSKSNGEFQTRILELSKRLFWFISTHPDETLTISPNELAVCSHLVDRNILTKLPKNPHIGQHIYTALVNNLYKKIPEDFQLKKLTHVKLNKTQIARMISNIGYIADAHNIISSESIPTSIVNGLDTEMFFKSSYGSRKGIQDKQDVTPRSGFLERTMAMGLSPIELISDDCGTKFGFIFEVKNLKHAHSLINRWFFNGKTHYWELLTEKLAISFIGTEITIRSPLTCGTQQFGICKKCFGNYKISSPYVGIIAGQCFAERLTQLALSAFHTSGSCTLPVVPVVVDFIAAHLVDIANSETSFVLEFDIDVPVEIITLISTIHGFTASSKNKVHFQNLYNVKNKDVTYKIKNLEILLKRSNIKVFSEMLDFYETFIETILSIGNIYSTFIEMVMANMFITKNNKIFRHELTQTGTINNIRLHKRLGIRKISMNTSKLLGLLYQPNTKTISELEKKTTWPPFSADTIYEQIWDM